MQTNKCLWLPKKMIRSSRTVLCETYQFGVWLHMIENVIYSPSFGKDCTKQQAESYGY